MAEISLNTITSSGGGGGGGGLTKVLIQQGTISALQTVIPITENGGVLPLSDDGVLLSSATGALQQGIGPGQYQINRGTFPDQIELNTAPLGPIDYVLQLIYQ